MNDDQNLLSGMPSYAKRARCNLDEGHDGPHGFTEDNPPYLDTGGMGEYNEGICGAVYRPAPDNDS